MPSMVRGRFVLAMLLALTLALSAAAQKPAADPFSDANRFQDKPAPVKKDKPISFADPFTPKKSDRIEDRITFTLKVTPDTVRRGETVKLEIQGVPGTRYYTYPLTQRGLEQPVGQLAVLTFDKVPGLQPLYPVAESTPVTEDIPGLGLHLKHKTAFTWTQDILVLKDAKPGKVALPFSIRLQVCDETCVMGELFFSVEFVVSDAAAVELTPVIQERLKIKEQEIKIVDGAAPAKPATAAPTPAGAPKARGAAAPPPTSGQDLSLLAFMLQGLLWGSIALFTPCVFPMIPITVSFFLKQSEKEGHQPFLMAAVYSLTIVVVLTVSGVALISVLQPFSQHWLTNAILGLIFFVFALSLFGMFDITLPSGLANLTQAQEGRGGLVGVIFMALTFTIISFTCVAPFYGNFIGMTASAESSGDWVKISLGALCFSLAFASPFFLLALFPAWLRSLPTSGGWMNTVKVVMGFLEVAAAAKFLRAGELGYFAKADLLTYDLCLGIYVALSILCGLYLLNLYRLPHDEESAEPVGVPRFMVSLVFLTLGLYMMPGLFKSDNRSNQRPTGAIFAWLDSFLLPDAKEEDVLPSGSGPGEGAKPSDRLAWTGGLEEGLATARKQGRLVFIDFTGLL